MKASFSVRVLSSVSGLVAIMISTSGCEQPYSLQLRNAEQAQSESLRPVRDPSSSNPEHPSNDPVLTGADVADASDGTDPTSLPLEPSVGPSNLPAPLPSPMASPAPNGDPSEIPSATPKSDPGSEPGAKPSPAPSTAPNPDPGSVPDAKPSTLPSSLPSSIPDTLPTPSPISNPLPSPVIDIPGKPTPPPVTVPNSDPVPGPDTESDEEVCGAGNGPDRVIVRVKSAELDASGANTKIHYSDFVNLLDLPPELTQLATKNGSHVQQLVLELDQDVGGFVDRGAGCVCPMLKVHKKLMIKFTPFTMVSGSSYEIDQLASSEVKINPNCMLRPVSHTTVTAEQDPVDPSQSKHIKNSCGPKSSSK